MQNTHPKLVRIAALFALRDAIKSEAAQMQALRSAVQDNKSALESVQYFPESVKAQRLSHYVKKANRLLGQVRLQKSTVDALRSVMNTANDLHLGGAETMLVPEDLRPILASYEDDLVDAWTEEVLRVGRTTFQNMGVSHDQAQELLRRDLTQADRF